MKTNDLPVTEEELHAFVDGELPLDRRPAVEAWLATHSEDAARVNAWRAQRDEIRARFGDIADQPVPFHLTIERLTRAGTRWKIGAAAAVIAAFLLGGVAGWHLRSAPAMPPSDVELLAAQAIDAHRLYSVEVRHPVEVTAEEAEHLSRWLSKRVGYPLRPPDLERVGLNLVGGRLLPTARGEAAALFMYEKTSGERVTLYCAKAKTQNAAMHFNGTDKTSAVYWVDGHIAYVVSGVAERKQLWNVAQAAYEQIERREAQPQDGS